MAFNNKPYIQPKFPHQSYEDRVVAFIDLLGFSAMVEKSATVEKERRRLTSAVDEFHRLIWEWEGDGVQSSFAFTQFSDSIVISSLAETQDSFEMLQMLLRGIVMLAGDYNILVRGGIARGLLIHDDTMLVGPAMVAAYHLESQKAISPRVIIDEKLKEEYDVLLKGTLPLIGITETPNWDKIFTKDDDGWWYLDYVKPSDEIYLGKVPMDLQDYKESLMELAQSGMQDKSEGVRAKYNWLHNKLMKTTTQQS